MFKNKTMTKRKVKKPLKLKKNVRQIENKIKKRIMRKKKTPDNINLYFYGSKLN